MRGTQLWKHRTGAGARNDDMDNTCELLCFGRLNNLKRHERQKAKDADRQYLKHG
ncbi:hypothetical protein [Desulfonema limicola]|uniref:hypothetical protein n=1 Tax=Desulfonema limicola TaxID=45656 RepID=UPI001A9AF113|nr:hypothetical protein [Desulfonema limicola]